MRVLLDNNVNQDFALLIKEHEVVHARKMGWAELENGDLIAAAERSGFDVMVTADKHMQYQQTLKGRKMSILVLNSRFIKWSDIKPLAPQVQQRLDGDLHEGSFLIISPDDQADHGDGPDR